MSDSSDFRVWADRAHKESLEKIPQRKSLYKCSNCIHRLTKNQAKLSGGYCTHCKSKLRAYNLFSIM